MMKSISIGIVGGGIIGLSTAAAILLRSPELKIVVYSDVFTPHTTGDVSAGTVLPHVVSENDDPATIRKWANETIEHLVKFTRDNEEANAEFYFENNQCPCFNKGLVVSLVEKKKGRGYKTSKYAITTVSGYQLWKKMPKPEEKFNYFKDCMLGWREVDQSELDMISTEGRYAFGVFCTTINCDCSKYLPCLMKNLAARGMTSGLSIFSCEQNCSQGVTFVEKKIVSLDDVADIGHDIVVNTTGFFAKYLTDDPEIRPYRGQIITAKAPWIKHFYRERDGETYIFPKSDYLVVGGTHDPDASLTIRRDVSNEIWKDAHLMVPNLKGASLIGERVGIRPGRSSVRIEIEQAMTKSFKKYVVLHHYGHAGYGVTLHWGSAKEAASVLKQYLDQHSKL